MTDRMERNLRAVYDEAVANAILSELLPRLDHFRDQNPSLSEANQSCGQIFSEQDVILITYGDQIQEPSVSPLRSLNEVLSSTVGDVINTVHILPFYPYTSDDGFSVVDYKEVDPNLGDWNDVQRLSARFRLMFDAVINHMSQASAWFQAYCRGEQGMAGFFISADPATDLSSVVRPRTTPLLTPFETDAGIRYVWTTFSADQVDLNYADPKLLLEVVDVLLFYVAMGARLIRLDAIAFLWKEVGTSCLHLPQTHALIRFLRAMLDEVAPNVLLVTETNVPHQDNISYFGDGYDEAQMVYNFTLPPLTLDAFRTGNAKRLTAWAQTLTTPSDETAFFNFMASHDGIGLRPVEGILSADEVNALAEQVKRHGGYVSYRTNPDGSESPYELNIVYYDALNDPYCEETQAIQVARFLCSQAILLSMAGVPGIYVHSLFGSRNWREGVDSTGRARTINRRKFQREVLESELAESGSVPCQVLKGYRRLLTCRIREPAFNPAAGQRVFADNDALFVVERTARDGGRVALCVHNVSARPVDYAISGEVLRSISHTNIVDLISGQIWEACGASLSLAVPPYAVLWLAPE